MGIEKSSRRRRRRDKKKSVLKGFWYRAFLISFLIVAGLVLLAQVYRYARIGSSWHYAFMSQECRSIDHLPERAACATDQSTREGKREIVLFVEIIAIVLEVVMMIVNVVMSVCGSFTYVISVALQGLFWLVVVVYLKNKYTTKVCLTDNPSFTVTDVSTDETYRLTPSSLSTANKVVYEMKKVESK